ncbi:hypothetical protein [Actinomadura graeca]|nr:hypothetical protein [Actinomadura graeca]
MRSTDPRLGKRRPPRRKPLDTPLVLVVIAVVISAGTALVFAR